MTRRAMRTDAYSAAVEAVTDRLAPVAAILDDPDAAAAMFAGVYRLDPPADPHDPGIVLHAAEILMLAAQAETAPLWRRVAHLVAHRYIDGGRPVPFPLAPYVRAATDARGRGRGKNPGFKALAIADAMEVAATYGFSLRQAAEIVREVLAQHGVHWDIENIRKVERTGRAHQTAAIETGKRSGLSATGDPAETVEGFLAGFHQRHG